MYDRYAIIWTDEPVGCRPICDLGTFRSQSSGKKPVTCLVALASTDQEIGRGP